MEERDTQASHTRSPKISRTATPSKEDVPRVLYLIDHLSRGGAAQVAVNTALSIDKRSYSPIVCTTRAAPESLLEKALEESDIPLIELNRRSRADLASWTKLWRVLPSVSILHSHESGSNFWGRLWGRLFRVPVIITQDHTAANEKPAVTHWADRMLSRLSSRIIAVSEFDRTLLIEHERLSPEKVVTIYNGIDPSRFDQPLGKLQAVEQAGLPRTEFLIAVIARLAEQKNHAGLFEALRLLPDDLQARTKCLLVGSGPLEADLRAHVSREGLNDIVVFLGERSDIPTILKAIDLLVLPSHWECLPIVILEALAAKTPIVATAVGGIPEVLGPLNWPLASDTDANGLAAAITKVAHMPESELAEISETGRRLIRRRFTREATTSQVEDLYNSLSVRTRRRER